MKRFTVLSILFLISRTIVLSQQLSHQVIVPLAGLAAEGNITYSQTVGETAVEMINCSEYIFTQGFQQPLVKTSNETRPEGNGVKVYPNPATDYLTIELFGESARTFRIDIINIAGRIVRSTRIELSDNYWYRDPQNIETLLSGFYLIRIISEDGVMNRTFKIEKI